MILSTLHAWETRFRYKSPIDFERLENLSGEIARSLRVHAHRATLSPFSRRAIVMHRAFARLKERSDMCTRETNGEREERGKIGGERKRERERTR